MAIAAPPTPSRTEFKQRRDEFMRGIGQGVAIFPAAPSAIRNNDVEHDYRTGPMRRLRWLRVGTGAKTRGVLDQEIKRACVLSVEFLVSMSECLERQAIQGAFHGSGSSQQLVQRKARMDATVAGRPNILLQ